LYYDGTYNGTIKNPPVVQSAPGNYMVCSASGWRFLSVGDGTYYIIGVSFTEAPQPPLNYSCGIYHFTDVYYTLTLESTGSGTGIEASSLTNSMAQRWKVIVVK
jgi:hypothetical protein